ncbi:Lantibiotic dehydratase, C terminus [Micromonospora matsumotoense]|uniref:Lantibiotic dehydratase, C terminus n=1 Tax=Micromonospora matsumotoense TaxID=121616 RepID=A0A1C4V0Z5_9ACTN|nr:lantibiotic dehydratase [Micromonospora matsumotoense]SCE77481.1 Lantibiotic dehydratase, C terminus [Micromonospora matsumotoense]
MSHLIPLGDTGWSVWRDVVLRSAGFPAAGLDRFAAPGVAAAADAVLAGEGSTDLFGKALGVAFLESSVVAGEIAADPLLREAVTWQNPDMLVALDGLLRTDPAVRNVRRRKRESSLLRYWQRYCGKAETIGFFGPVCWGVFDPAHPGVQFRPGAGLVARRQVVFEAWALIEYADRLADDLAVRRWWAPMRQPHLTVEERRLRWPLHPPIELTATEARLLAACDGRTPAVELARRLHAEGLVHRADDGYLLLDRWVDRGQLSWGANLPISPDAERVLAERIAAIGDDTVRAGATAGFDRLRAARDTVAAAAGDPDRLVTALAGLSAEFTAVTGRPATRHRGQMYAGRTVCYEDSARDLEFRLGATVLDALAAPLAVVLQAARWLTAEIGAGVTTLLSELHDELAVDGPVRLADIWSLAQGTLVAPHGPIATAAADLTERWARLFGLRDLPAGCVELRLSAADLAGQVHAVFPADRPGWPSARLHNPDVQIAAASPEALDRGEFLLVLGELHPAAIAFDSAVLSMFHPDPATLRADLDTDLGPARLRVLWPESFPRRTTRTTYGLTGPTDRELGIDTARGADVDRLVAATAVTVGYDGDELVAVLPDGVRWPLVEVFAQLLGALLLDAFKLLDPAPHTPRITIDRLVVARRTWRTTVGACGLAGHPDESTRYLAVRRWRAADDLPERVFVKVGTEVKPCYVDLTGPLYAQSLCAMVDAAARTGPDVPLVVTELLPAPADAWVPDAAGRGHVSELRLQITDPATYRGVDPASHRGADPTTVRGAK